MEIFKLVNNFFDATQTKNRMFFEEQANVRYLMAVCQSIYKALTNFQIGTITCLSAGMPEGGRREQAPLLPFSWWSRGSKSALFKCSDFFVIVNMIQRTSYRLKASNI